MKSKLKARNGEDIDIIAFRARSLTACQRLHSMRVVRSLKAIDADKVNLLQNYAQYVESGEAEGLLSLFDE